MGNWWEVQNWDWGGAGNALRDGFVAVNFGIPGMIADTLLTGRDNIAGRIGHEFLGGKERQQAERTQSALETLMNQPQENPFVGQANPYAPGSPGMLAMLAQTQGGIRRNFADARDQTMRSLAQRGALGSAQETSALRRLALDEARATSGAEAELTARNYDKSANWGLSMLANGVDWDERRRREKLGFMADTRDRYEQQGFAPLQALSQLAGLGVKAGTAYATGGKSLMGGF